MRVALVTTEHISQNSGGGGLASYVHRSAKALQRLGCEPIVFLVGDEIKKNKILKNINYQDFKIYLEENDYLTKNLLNVNTPKFFKKVRFLKKTVFLLPNFFNWFLYKYFPQTYFLRISTIQFRGLLQRFISYQIKKNQKDSKNQIFEEFFYDEVRVIKVNIFLDQIPYHFFSKLKTARIFKKRIRLLNFKNIFSLIINFKKQPLHFDDKVIEIFKKYSKSCVASFFINKIISEFNNKNPFDIIHYTNLNGLAIMRPKNIPAIVRVSGIHRLWWKVNEVSPTPEMLVQDNLEFDALESVEKVICPSNNIKNEILKEKNVNISVIESPFVISSKEEDFSVLNNYSLAEKKYALFFGQVSALKGVVEIAEIIYEFLKDNPDFYYVFVGQVYKYQGLPISDFILNNAKEFSNRVIFIPRQEHSKLFPIIKASQFVTLPSRMDNLPNACIESMFFGKIVIGSNGVSFEQLIDNGISGFLCEPNNSKSIILKINEILNLSEDRKKQISFQAKDRIKKLQPEIVTNQLLDFYKSAIELHKKNKSICVELQE